MNAHSTAFAIISDGKVAWCTLELWLFYCTKKKDDRNAAKANHRVYRTVKSAIDYRRGDNAITHLLKVQRICDTLLHSCEDWEWRHFAEYNCILSRLTSVCIPRVYLHFGARDATRPSVLSVYSASSLYVPLATTDIYRSYRIVFLVNFNKHRVNAKFVWDTEWIYPSLCHDRVDYWRRPPKWPVLMPLSGTRYSMDASVARNYRIDSHRCTKICTYTNISKQNREISKIKKNYLQ